MGGFSGGGNSGGNDFTPLPIKIAKEVFVEGPRRSKQNVMDYEGQAAGVTPMRAPSYNQREGNDNNNQPSAKSIEQPKVASQMNAPKAATSTTPGPTTTEMVSIPEATTDEKLIKTKKKGRRSTILTSPTGLEEDVTLSKKTLLG